MDALNWLAEHWIALGALLIAAGTWFDTRRRLREAEIGFAIEPNGLMGKEHRFLLRNTGGRAVVHPELDPESVRKWEVPWTVSGGKLEPNDAAPFTIVPDRYGELPDTVRVIYRRSFGGKARSRLVRFPTVDVSEQRPAPEAP